VSGRRHHLLPKFLLRGFLSKTKKERSFVYSKKAGVYEASLDRVSVERDFYGSLDSTATDDTITAAESAYAKLIQHLRETGDVEDKQSEIRELIVHISLRVKRAQDGMQDMGRSTTAILRKYFGDEDSLQHSLKNYMRNNLDDLATSLFQELRKVGGTDPAKFLVDRLTESGKLQELMEAQLEETMNERGQEVISSFNDVMDEMDVRTPSIVKSSMNRLLAQSAAPELRVESLSPFRFELQKITSGLVLGDCAVFARHQNGSEVIGMFEPEKISWLALPISSTQLLVGFRDGSRSEIAAHEANSLSAKLSGDYFVAAKRSETWTSLVALIGTASPLPAEIEFERVGEEVFGPAV
jgi:hypothetical protein